MKIINPKPKKDNNTNGKTIALLGFFTLIGFCVWYTESLMPLWALLLTEFISKPFN